MLKRIRKKDSVRSKEMLCLNKYQENKEHSSNMKDYDHDYSQDIRKIEHGRVRMWSCLPQENKHGGKKNIGLSHSMPQLNNILF